MHKSSYFLNNRVLKFKDSKNRISFLYERANLRNFCRFLPRTYPQNLKKIIK